jgi:pyruvate dehydrogenase E2 component (dihydrolipoamide acetyltransferase)/2-oxoglutarate dehydrogenase E2 component (dihydrolipoamide succinyltransferase)
MASMKILLPQFGMGMQEAEIVRWLKAVGDMVEVGEPLVEIAAAKATVEIPSPGSGALTEIIARDGEIVAVRAHIATLTL